MVVRRQSVKVLTPARGTQARPEKGLTGKLEILDNPYLPLY